MKCDCCPNERRVGATGWVQTPMGENLCPTCVAVIAQIEDTRPVVTLPRRLTKFRVLSNLGFATPDLDMEVHS